MAYENYSVVSWTDLTPITSARLNQMSTNIEQVKDATGDKPQGIKKIKTISSNVTVTQANALVAHEIIYLKNEGNGTDNRITPEVGRYYRLKLSFPGIAVSGAGAEDSTYYLAIKDGIFGNSNTVIANYRLSSGPGLFVNVASATASTSNIALNSTIRFGAGTYEYVFSGDGTTNKSYFVEVIKVAGSSGSNRATAYNVVASETPMQFYIEDVGGVA